MTAIVIDTRGLAAADRRLQQVLRNISDPSDILEVVAGVVESSTKRRISDEKAAPDGNPWQPWSPEYARTRGPQHSLNIDTQGLLDSIASEVRGDEVAIGSPQHYSPFVQETRPFLGISKSDQGDIEDQLRLWLSGQFR